MATGSSRATPQTAAASRPRAAPGRRRRFPRLGNIHAGKARAEPRGHRTGLGRHELEPTMRRLIVTGIWLPGARSWPSPAQLQPPDCAVEGSVPKQSSVGQRPVFPGWEMDPCAASGFRPRMAPRPRRMFPSLGNIWVRTAGPGPRCQRTRPGRHKLSPTPKPESQAGRE